MPGLAVAGPRASGAALDWGPDGLGLDSLARMQLATAAATWCNAYDAGYEDLFLAKRSVADWAQVMRRARASGAQHFTFASSGSTGARQHIRHREDILTAEAQAWAAVLTAAPHQPNQASQPTPSIQRVVVLAPTHHIYGFIWGVLVPLALSVPVVDADLAALPVFLPGDLVVAVPDQWAWLAGRRWPAGVCGVSSTAPLPDAVHRKLTDPLANAPGPSATLVRLLQIYGSSETAGLAWRDAPDQPYTLAPGRTPTPEGGIELLLPNGTQAALPVQDELRWAGPNQFELLRRSDHAVQVGGHNVSPNWVAAQLLTHPAVQHAAVRLSTTATPPRLKAFVVLHPASGQSDESAHAADLAQRNALQAWAASTLPWYASLCTITYGSELPRNAMGKPSDWQD